MKFHRIIEHQVEYLRPKFRSKIPLQSQVMPYPIRYTQTEIQKQLQPHIDYKISKPITKK
jgi:hypothetical protein